MFSGARRHRFKRTFLIFIAAIVILLLLFHLKAFDSVESQTEDSLYQKQIPISNDIYIIGIDSETLENYGKFDKWSREKIADLIDLLNSDPDNKPLLIGIDINFFGYSDYDTDMRLANSIKEAGNVILADSATIADTVGEGNSVIIYEQPYDELLSACYGTGFSNASFDSDGVVRHYIGEVSFSGKTYPSFARALYEAYMEKTGNESLIDDFGGNFYIRYSGYANTYFGSVGAGCSLYRVLEGLYPTKTFKDAIVLVGAHASGLQDNYYASIDKREQMYGVEIHANALEQMIDGEYKQELSETAIVLITIIASFLAIFSLSFLASKFAFAINILLAIIYLLVAKILYTKCDIVMPVLIPLLGILIITIVSIAYSHLTNEKDRKRLIDNYSKYLSKDVASTIANEGIESDKLGEHKKNVAILFADIRGFTSLSENLGPEEVVSLLNRYFELTTAAINEQGGMVDKYIGDSTMGIFNAIEGIEDYEYRACLAAFNMLKKYDEFSRSLPEKYRRDVDFGIGINSGEVIVGTIGTNDRKEYTAIGDVVNTASRIEGKANAHEILVSENVYKAVSDKFIFEDKGMFALKGKKKDTHIYKIISLKDGKSNE